MSQKPRPFPQPPTPQAPPWVTPPTITPVRIDLEQDTPDYANLKCPVCGFHHSQLTGVEVRGGIGPCEGVGTRVDGSGTRVFYTPVKRGVAVDIEFSGECGHEYVYTFEFHEGQIHVSQRSRPGPLKPSIWRD